VILRCVRWYQAYGLSDRHLLERMTEMGLKMDASGQTVAFLLSNHRDTLLANRFFEKVLRSPHNGSLEALIVEPNPTYHPVMSLLQREGQLGEEADLTTGQWLKKKPSKSIGESNVWCALG
jgi:transposase-like protein